MKGAITTAQAQAAVSRYGSQRKAAKALGFKSRKPITNALKRVETPSNPRTRRSKGLSRAQFAATYDGDTRTRTFVETAVQTLTDDEVILDDAQFRVERCHKASTGNWRTITSEPAFTKYRFEVKGKVFWTSPTTKKWALENIEGAKG